MKNFAIVCGGTGGHLSPGIAVAEQLLESGNRCTLVISDKNIDCLMLKKYPHLSYSVTHARPFSKNPIRFFKFVFSQIRSLFFAIFFLRRGKIDCIIGFGGFTNVPFVLAGALLKKKVVLHESNRVIGKSVRILSYFADKIYLPEGVNFRSRFLNKKVECVGYPIRKEFVIYDRTIARRELNIDPNKYLILVMGGSQGAKALTNWAIENCEILNQNGILVYCLTGGEEKHVGENIFKNFSDNMCALYNACDLAVARAGAGTIAELNFYNKPAIFVPYPYAADDHQTKNAQYVASKGRDRWLPEKEINNLTKLVIRTLEELRDGGGERGENPVYKIVSDVTR